MVSFSVFIGALILLINLILISRVIYNYAKVWMDTHTSLQTHRDVTNYEKLADEIFGNLTPPKELTVSVALKFNSKTSPTTYIENHNVTTDKKGAISIQLGKGEITKGNYNTLAWGGFPAFMKISVNKNHCNSLHANYSSMLT